MNWERGHKNWPWLIRKNIEVVQFSPTDQDAEGHNQFGAKLYFTFFGFHVGDEYLLTVNPQSPYWGTSWVTFAPNDIPAWSEVCNQEQVIRSLDRWTDYISGIKKNQDEDRRRRQDRGTFVSKYRC